MDGGIRAWWWGSNRKSGAEAPHSKLPAVERLGGGEAADPDAGSGGLAEMHGMAGGTKGEGLVIFAFQDFEFGGGAQMEAVEEFEEAFVLFVDAEDFGAFAGAEFGEENGTVFAQFGDAAAKGHTVGTGFVCGETLHEESFDLGRDGVLHAFGFGVGFGPGEADDFGEEHFGELMAKHEVPGNFASLGSEEDASTALDLDVAIAGHAL